MVSKKVHCAYCQKKCSGNVLRYQDQYYHKQCFELEQSESLASEPEARVDVGSTRAAASQPELQVGSAASASDVSPRHARHETRRETHSSTRTFSSHSASQQNAGATLNGLNATPEPATTSARAATMAPARTPTPAASQQRSATLPHSISSPANGFTSAPPAASAGQLHQKQAQQHRQTDGNSRTLDSRSAPTSACAGCREKIVDGQALIALDLHWHVWCFKCVQCRAPLHGEYVAKDGRAYCEKDYQKLFGITCVYCKRYITGKVLQAGEAHHFHPSCARCSKCGDPFVPGEEMYLQGEVTWHPRCGPGPTGAESSLMETESQLRNSRAQSPGLSAGSGSRSRSASPFSYMSRQYGRASPAYADSEAVGDLSRIYTISYLNSDPNQGYLRRPIEPNPPKSPQFSRPTSLSRLGGVSDRSRCSSRSQLGAGHYGSSTASGLGGRDRSVPRGMYSVLSGMRGSGSSSRARSPSMMNEEAIQLAAYPSGQKPAPDSVPKIERDDFPAPPFPYPDRHHAQAAQRHAANQQQQNGHSQQGQQLQQPEQAQERASRPRSREIGSPASAGATRESSSSSADLDPQFRKEEEELSKIANGIGKIFLQTLKEREKLRAWKRANLDPRNASRTPSATRELPSRMRYENPLNASPSRDMDRPRPWEADENLNANSSELLTPTPAQAARDQSPARAPGSAISSSAYGYKVVQSNRSTPRPGYGLTSGPYGSASSASSQLHDQHLSFAEQQRAAQARATDLLGRQTSATAAAGKLPDLTRSGGSTRSLASAAHFRRSMPNVASLRHLHQEGPPKLYPYHLLATSNYRLPPDVDRCHLERHLSNEEFQYIFHCDRLDFYRLPEWKRNELKRRARLF